MLARIHQADATFANLTARIEALLDAHDAAVSLLIGIPGVSYRSAQVVLAEIGTGMSRFPTAGHLASWAGMCPGNNESAGKHRSRRTRRASKWLGIALVEAAHAAGKSKNTYLSSQYARIRGRRGSACAAVAVGHSILVIVWHLLSTGETYTDLGGDYFDKRRTSTAHQRRLVAQLEAMATKSPSNQQPERPPIPTFGATPRAGAAAPTPLRDSRPATAGDSHLSEQALAVCAAVRVFMRDEVYACEATYYAELEEAGPDGYPPVLEKLKVAAWQRALWNLYSARLARRESGHAIVEPRRWPPRLLRRQYRSGVAVTQQRGGTDDRSCQGD